MAVVVNVYGKADLKQIDAAQRSLNNLKREAVRTSGGVGGAFSSMGRVVSSTGAKITATLATAGITRWLKSSVGAAKESISAQARLEAAVTASGASWASQGKQIDALIQKHSKLAAVDDEELAGAFATLTQTTGSSAAAMKYLGLVTDVSRGAHISLSDAGKLVGKVASGNTSSLSRYGITLQKGATAQEALGLLQKRFAGQAKDYGQSEAGAADRVAISMENLQETIGTSLLPVVTSLAGKTVTLLEKFQSLPGPLQSIAIGIAAVAIAAALIAPFATNIIAVAKAMKIAAGAQWIWNKAMLTSKNLCIGTRLQLVRLWVAQKAQTVATKAAAVSQWLLNVAMTANPIMLVVVALGVLVGAFVIAWRHSEKFRAVVVGTWSAIKSVTMTVASAVLDFLKRWGPLVLAALTGPLGLAVYAIAKHWGQIKGAFTSGMSACFGAVRSTGGSIVSWIGGLPGRMASAISGGALKLFGAGVEIGRNLINGVIGMWNRLDLSIPGFHINTHLPGVGTIGWDGISDIIPDAAYLAHGGLVSKATLAMVGDNPHAWTDPEVIAPLSKLKGMLGETSRHVVIESGAIQVAFPHGTSASLLEVRATIDQAMHKLAAEIKRR